MVEIDVAEIARILMAGGTGTRIVVGRRTVAGGTIGAANRGMVKHRIAEAACIAVTGGTSPSKVICWGCVTG